MAKEDANFWQNIETDNWNIAKSYSEMTAEWMRLIDYYEIIAEYGSFNLGEEFSIPEDYKTQIRIRAIERLRKFIELIITDSLFAVTTNGETKLKEYLGEVRKMRKVIPLLMKTTVQKNKKITLISEESFREALDLLIDLKTNIKYDLNDADLIYKKKDDFDLEKFKEDKIKYLTGE